MMTEPDLIRALRVVALSNEERMVGLKRKETELIELLWFVERIDDLAPELRRRGWIEFEPFTKQRGEIVVTDGQGDLRRVEITELGRRQLNAAVVA